MAPIRQLQHLLVHWDLNKNHAGVFIHMSKQTNQQNLGRQYLTKRTLILPKQYTPFQEPKKQRRVSLSAAGKRELFRWRTCACCIIHRAEVCSSESLKWSRCKRVHLVVKRVSCLRCQGMEEFHSFQLSCQQPYENASREGDSRLTPACQPPTPCILSGFGKGLCENRGREGAERGFVSWLPRTLCFNLPFLFFIFFSNLTKWICLFFFSLNGKWLQWLSPLIFIELKFHWPPFLHEAYFIPWWSAGLDIRPS